MIVFPWLAMIVLLGLVALAVLLLITRTEVRFRQVAAPIALTVTTLAVTIAGLAIVVLAWGLLIKPR